VEQSLRPRLGEYVFEEENSPLTMLEAAGTEAGNPILIKMTTGKVRRNSSTHGEEYEEDHVDK